MRSIGFSFALVILLLAALPMAGGCSSSSSSPGTAGGDSGTAHDGAAEDSSSADSSSDGDTGTSTGGCPSYSGSNAFCSAAASYCTTCSQDLSACAVEHFSSYCVSVSDVYNPSIVPALAQCTQHAACTAADGGGDPCVATALAGATPSTAQEKVATDFCAACAGDAGTAGCMSSFFTVSTSGGASGPGYFVLAGNDTVAMSIDTTCTGSFLTNAGSSCEADFVECSASVLASGFPPDPCGDGGLSSAPPRSFPSVPGL